MSHSQKHTVVSNEDLVGESGLSTNPGQTQINVINNVMNIQHQQVIQQDQRHYPTTSHDQSEPTSTRTDDEQGASNAFRKLKEATRELYNAKLDVDVSRFDNPATNFPEIHPELLSVDFYEGRCIPNDDQYDPKTRQIEFKESDKKASIDQLLSKYQSQNFLSIVGYPGAGKTTLSKRLARRLDQNRDFLVLRIPFMSMSDGDDVKLTLQDLLLGDVNFNLKEEEKNALFDWIKNHSQNVFLIFDGFDQVSWNVSEKVKNVNYDTFVTYQNLVSNLCHGYFLRNCHIVFTSRPHAMLDIPQTCRPKQTYFIRDLTSENMKMLFDALINHEQKASKLWNELTLKTPHLESMCNNPLLLQLYLRASFGSSHETVNISTMTRIFHRVLENLKASGHTILLTDAIVNKLSKIAFTATKNKTVLIKIEDLVKEDLRSREVQDIVVTLFGSNRTCGLLEGNRRLYFTHQTFQEFFSALYLVYQMPVVDFITFVQKNLLENHWSVVVQFLSGLLLDPYMNKDLSRSAINYLPPNEPTSTLTKSSSLPTFSSSQIASTSSSCQTSKQSSNESTSFQPPTSFQKTISSQLLSREKLQKKKVFMSKLHKITRKVAAKHNDYRSIIAISRILREGNDEEMTVTAGNHFDGGKISMNPSDSQNDFHAMTTFLKSMPARIGILDLDGCKMTSNKFRPWIEASKSMPGSIVQMDLRGNLLSSVNDVIEVLHKVVEWIVVFRSLDDGGEGWRSPNMEERARLQEVLNGLDNKKLMILVDLDNHDHRNVYLTHKDLVDTTDDDSADDNPIHLVYKDRFSSTDDDSTDDNLTYLTHEDRVDRNIL